MAGSSGQSRQLLYELLVRHIDSGRRTRKLQPRKVKEPVTEDNGNGEDENGTDE